MTKNDLLHSLSNSLGQLYETGDDHNVIIEVGKDLNDLKTFKAHSYILRARSTYFKSALSNNWVIIKDNSIIYFNKPNISPLIFDIILRYIYTGNINFDKDNITQIIDLMIAADEMGLLEIINYIQNYILENSGIIKKDIVLLYNTFVKMHPSQHFGKLKKKIEKLLFNNPQLLFNMNDVYTLEESGIISLINSEHIKMREFDIWKRVLEWGISRTNIISREFSTWTKEEFIELNDSLRNVLPLIRFQEMSLKQFQDDSIIISSLVDSEVFKELLLSFPPTPVDSMIITEKNATNLLSMICNGDFCCVDSFNLLFRQNKNSLNFHEFTTLENTNNTMIVCKLDRKFEIIGGYCPGRWKINERKLVLDECFTIRFRNRNFGCHLKLDDFEFDNKELWEFGLDNNKIHITTAVTSTRSRSFEIIPETLEIFKLEK
ncbi:hypothetical protein C1645_777761 [Glomus cerebriforme]|uniref:BTB domain-containing protein n=1 Tax=Glomus cerebriforme TaxID=658196 RepID=A0A397ST74_9GLOM|nr:hypothetical protein C1645_777761 [Glomus cerebriforme]